MAAIALPPPRAHSESLHQARLLAALADASRLRIIQCLRDGPLTVGEIARAVDLAVVNASHHLGVLRQAGIVQDQKRGRFVIYQLHPDKVPANDRNGSADTLLLHGLKLELMRE